MSQATAINTTHKLTIADLNTDIDNEPRVHDLQLATALGYNRQRIIRELITRNETELKTYGSLAARYGKSRGQHFTEYFLNEGQALLICMFSKTEKAAAVRKMLIDVFMEYRRNRITKPITVRKHNRRTSTKIEDALNLKRNIDRLEAVADKIQPHAPNMCAMVIDGQPVFVDVNKYDGAGRAVVLEHDGSVKIQNITPRISDFNPIGVRMAMGEPYLTTHGTTARRAVIVIGMVIEQGVQPMQPLQPMQIDHVSVNAIAKPVSRAPYKDKILALLGTGLSKREIAEKVGCSVHGVDYWYRKIRRA